MMNLKEAFRYQNALNALLDRATASIAVPSHCFNTTRLHFRHDANPDAEDMVEQVETEAAPKNDDVLKFLSDLIEEKQKVTKAIANAKACTNSSFDIDAAVETNKYRQRVASAINSMLSNKPGKTIEMGRDYKFNAEGNQLSYVYSIQVEVTDAYDRNAAKGFMRQLISEADKVSNDIDAALINMEVHHEPRYNVHDSFEDIMETYSSTS